MMQIPNEFWKWATAYYGDDIDMIDIEALYDRSVSASENITEFKDRCPRSEISRELVRMPQQAPIEQPGIYQRSARAELFADLLARPRVIGVIADVNQGKSMLLYNVLADLRKEYAFKLYYYGLREDIPDAIRVYSVAEMEEITDSVVIVDELSSLFDLDDRKVKRAVERFLRLINHNNNALVLCGTPENYKKFISAKLDAMVWKKTTIADCINGSAVKNRLLAYKGNEMGSEVLNVPVDKAIVWDGKHYKTINVTYMPQYDTKKSNENVLKSVRKSVLEKVEQ